MMSNKGIKTFDVVNEHAAPLKCSLTCSGCQLKAQALGASLLRIRSRSARVAAKGMVCVLQGLDSRFARR